MQKAKPSNTSSAAVEDLFTNLFQECEAFLRPRWEKMEEQVRESPTKAVLIAAGVGYVLHRLPCRSLLATSLKLLWGLAPPAVMAVAAGKCLQAIEERVHPDQASAKPGNRRQQLQETAP